MPECESTSEAQRLRISGRQLAFCRMGSQSPTVIFETGLGAESSEWSPVQESIASIACTLRYDRVGRGRSDPADRIRSAEDMVGDLRSLLRVAELPGPYILVGHSFGGLLMRLFAHWYRDEVCALVLVDAMNEMQFDVIGSALPPVAPEDPPALQSFRKFWCGGWKDPRATPEKIDFAECFRQISEAHSLGHLPVRVISAGTAMNSPFLPAHTRPALQASWNHLQSQFLQLSSNARQTFALQSGHFVQRDAPDVITDTIRELIATTRS